MVPALHGFGTNVLKIPQDRLAKTGGLYRFDKPLGALKQGKRLENNGLLGFGRHSSCSKLAGAAQAADCRSTRRRGLANFMH
jgi:hypothetical protein